MQEPSKDDALLSAMKDYTEKHGDMFDDFFGRQVFQYIRYVFRLHAERKDELAAKIWQVHKDVVSRVHHVEHPAVPKLCFEMELPVHTMFDGMFLEGTVKDHLGPIMMEAQDIRTRQNKGNPPLRIDAAYYAIYLAVELKYPTIDSPEDEALYDAKMQSGIFQYIVAAAGLLMAQDCVALHGVARTSDVAENMRLISKAMDKLKTILAAHDLSVGQ